MDDDEKKMLKEMHVALLGDMLANPPRPGVLHNQQRMMTDLYGPDLQPHKGVISRLDWVIESVKTFTIKYKTVAAIAGVIGSLIGWLVTLFAHR